MARNNLQAHLGVLVAEFLFAFTILATQEILNHGVNNLVLACYCLGLSAVLLWIPALFIKRDTNMKVSLKVLGWILLLGVLVFLLQFFGLVGQELTSPSFVTGMQPLSSIFTAVFSVAFGVEKLDLRRYDGKTKVAGVLTCVAGAMVMTLYKGSCVIDCAGEHATPPTLHATKSALQFQFGAVCVIISNMVCGVLGALTTRLLYKHNLSPTPVLAIMFTIGTVLSGSVALLEADKSAWVLHGRFTLVLVILIVLAVSVFPVLLIKAVYILGPTIVSCYQPVCTIVATCVSVALFGSTVYLGSLMGAVILIFGLLCVSWAQEQFTRLSSLETLLPTR